jgi:tetratricopeptide (TPR) repeat protein
VILGEVYAARGQTFDAIDAYRDALKLDKSLVEVRLKRAKLLINSGAVRKGVKQLKKVIKTRPDLAEAHLYLGVAYTEANREDKAMAAFRAALARDKTLGIAHFKIGQILFDKRKFPPATVSLKKAVQCGKKEDSWFPEAHYLLGSSALNSNNKKLATETFKAYLKVAPDGAALIPEVKKQLRKLGVSFKKVDDF